MKQIILTGLFSVGIVCAQAQVAADNYNDDDNGNKKIRTSIAAGKNEFMNTEMAYANKTVSFTDLPQLPKATWAIITNTNGEQLKQMRVTLEHNNIDVRHFQNGMYFVNLIYRNKSKKGFVLQVD